MEIILDRFITDEENKFIQEITFCRFTGKITNKVKTKTPN